MKLTTINGEKTIPATDLNPTPPFEVVEFQFEEDVGHITPTKTE